MGNDYTDKKNINLNNNGNSQEFGKVSIINSEDNILKDNINIINPIKKESQIKNSETEENFNELLLKSIQDINSNLINLNEKDRNFEYPKNIAVYDNVINEMKSDYTKKKNKKFKYEIKNEIKNTFIKPIMDNLQIKEKEITEMKSQIGELKKYILDSNAQTKKEFDLNIENLKNKNNTLFEQFTKLDLDKAKIISKYDSNFLNLNKQIESIKSDIKTLENKNQKEFQNLQKKIPNDINSLKNEINININKKEIENNSKYENILKLNKENIHQIENLRKQFDSEVKSLKNELQNLENEQKKLIISDENKGKELFELKQKINSNKRLIDNAIKEIEIINKNSKKKMTSIVNESFKKFNNIFQKNYSLKKYKTQKELKLKLFNHKNYARVGLNNIGNNCYINSVLQILKNIPKFTYNFFIMDEGSGKFLLSLKNLLLKTCFSKDSSFSPNDFKDNLGKENKRFSGDKQYDSTIFYISLLNIIQKKICKPNNNYKKIDMNQYSNISLEEKFNIWKENYLSKNQSFIIDFFYIFYASEIQCKSCNYISQSFQCTNFLDFPLVSDKKQVKELEECFYNYQMIKTLLYECSECKKNNLTQNFTILELPPILVINLKRVGEGNANLNDIEIPFQLDMEKLIKNGKMSSIYELRGFIKHSGDEVSGHNYSFCKNMFDDKWYEYNDSYCIPIEGTPTLDTIFLLCYVKIGSDIQDINYLQKIIDSLDEENFFNKFKNH